MTDHSHLQDAIDWASRHATQISIAIGGILGSITWIFNEVMLKRFATIEALQRCRDQTVSGFQKALDDHESRSLTREVESHSEIKQEIEILSTRIGSVDGKLDQLKNMLLQKEWINK
jgi:hypothetical protein